MKQGFTSMARETNRRWMEDVKLRPTGTTT